MKFLLLTPLLFLIGCGCEQKIQVQIADSKEATKPSSPKIYNIRLEGEPFDLGEEIYVAYKNDYKKDYEPIQGSSWIIEAIEDDILYLVQSSKNSDDVNILAKGKLKSHLACRRITWEEGQPVPPIHPGSKVLWQGKRFHR